MEHLYINDTSWHGVTVHDDTVGSWPLYNNTIRHNTIRHFAHNGIDLHSGAYNTQVYNNTIEFEDAFSQGIYFHNRGDNLTAWNNVVRGVSRGLYCEPTSGNFITNVIFMNNTVYDTTRYSGCYATGGTLENITFKDNLHINTATDNSYANLFIRGADNVVIQNEEFHNIGNPSQARIKLVAVDNASVLDLTNTTTKIAVEASTASELNFPSGNIFKEDNVNVPYWFESYSNLNMDSVGIQTFTVTRYMSTIKVSEDKITVSNFSPESMVLDYYNTVPSYVYFSLSSADAVSNLNVNIKNVPTGTTLFLKHSDGTLIDQQTSSSEVYFNNLLAAGDYYITSIEEGSSTTTSTTSTTTSSTTTSSTTTSTTIISTTSSTTSSTAPTSSSTTSTTATTSSTTTTISSGNRGKSKKPSGNGGGAGARKSNTVFHGMGNGTKKGLITEDSLIDVMSFLGHDFGSKYSFSQDTSPMSSLYAAKDEVVMSIDLASRLVTKMNLANLGLKKYEAKDLYEDNIDYVTEHYPGGDTLIVARGDMEFDSLAATSLSSITRAPIILVEPNKIPDITLNYIKERFFKVQRKYEKIYLIGGTEAVSDGVEDELKNYAQEIVRLGGATRYETSIAVADEVMALGGSRLPLMTSGKAPVIYTATLANKYRSPIIYLDTPPIEESTFKTHNTIEGSLTIESFRTYQTIGVKSPKFTMNIDIETENIQDAWMYVHTIGFDSVAEKWSVKFNDYSVAYQEPPDPVALNERFQLTRFDVGTYVKTGQNTLFIEGTDFNLNDHFYITDVTFIITSHSDEKTEHWINEGADTYFEDGSFKHAGNAKLYNIYLNEERQNQLEFNGNLLQTSLLQPTTLKEAPQFSTIEVAEVTGRVSNQNTFTGGEPALSILTVTSEDIDVNPPEIKVEPDPHQSFVLKYLDLQKFDSIGMLYFS
jgi:putative cell wall-binding protein